MSARPLAFVTIAFIEGDRRVFLKVSCPYITCHFPSPKIHVLKYQGSINTHFSIRNLNFWSKVFILNVWSSQCSRLLRPCIKWRGKNKNDVVPSVFMKFWSRKNLDQLDWLTPYDIYYVWSTNELTTLHGRQIKVPRFILRTREKQLSLFSFLTFLVKQNFPLYFLCFFSKKQK